MSEFDDLLDPGVKSQHPQNNNFGQGKPLPNGNAVLVLGIISIATCWMYAIPGLVCGIIALVLYKRDKALLEADPTGYSESSIKNAKAGNVCAIIGTSLSAAFILFILIYLIFVISVVSSIPTY